MRAVQFVPMPTLQQMEKSSVLVVDDNEATSTLMRALLAPHFAVEFATDGNEAIEKLRVKNYAATLLDLRMPQGDGFAVLDFLKSTRPEALRSVIVVTALLTKHEIARVRTYDVAGIVAKPFEIEVLLSAVKACAGMDDGPGFRNMLYGPAIFLLADFLRRF